MQTRTANSGSSSFVPFSVRNVTLELGPLRPSCCRESLFASGCPAEAMSIGERDFRQNTLTEGIRPCRLQGSNWHSRGQSSEGGAVVPAASPWVGGSWRDRPGGDSERRGFPWDFVKGCTNSCTGDRCLVHLPADLSRLLQFYPDLNALSRRDEPVLGSRKSPANGQTGRVGGICDQRLFFKVT